MPSCRILSRFVAGLVLVGCCSLASANELAESCNDCHGQNGNTETAGIPSIAGISEYYFMDTMISFAEGARPAAENKRSDGSVTSMKEIAEKLSEKEIDELASYYAKLTFERKPQPFDKEKAALGKNIHAQNCERCHENVGRSVEDDAGLLAGQDKKYLENVFKQMASGDLVLNDKMMKKVERVQSKYGDAGFDSLVDYYASQL